MVTDVTRASYSADMTLSCTGSPSALSLAAGAAPLPSEKCWASSGSGVYFKVEEEV